MDLKLNAAVIPKERFALAFSGGGDSTALLYAVRDKNPLVFIVDHGLRSGSAAEATAAQNFATSLGLEASVLKWQPPPLSGGLQAKARAARYGLLGEACRANGVSYLLTGHTEDDQVETVLMRLKTGGSWRGAAAMRAVTPSPLWPELAAISICRPMLSCSRAQVRTYLAAHNLPFVDDPSNENRSFARIRARDALRQSPQLRKDMAELSRDMGRARARERQRLALSLKAHVKDDLFGNLFLGAVPTPYFLGHLIRAASGTGGFPREAELTRLAGAMKLPQFNGASLGGAMITARKNGFMISRDPVVGLGRSGQPPLPEAVFSGRVLWDGRFWIDGEGTLSPAGMAWRDAPAQMATALKECPAPARAGLPVWRKNGAIIAIGPVVRNGQKLASISGAILPRLKREFESSCLEPK